MNVFDRPDGVFTVLINDDGRHSLWPGGLDVPTGWRVAHVGDSRAACLAFVEEHWRDQQPSDQQPSGQQST